MISQASIDLCKVFRTWLSRNICNTWISALPDMYAQYPRASADISGNAQIYVQQIISYTSNTKYHNGLLQ